MRSGDVFPSKYIKAADLQDRPVKVVMAHCEVEKIGDDKKPVLYFDGKEKGLVLNVTNWRSIAKMYGDDSDGWAGKPITLIPAVTDFRGETTECVRIKPETPGKAAAKPTENPGAGLDDEIPF